MSTSHLLRPVFWLFLFSAVTAILSAAKWDALKPEELAATQPVFDHAADAEVLFSKVDISFSDNTTTKECYRRIKVYSARGVELVQKFGIDYTKYSSISRLAARLTKPGGASTEFSKKDFLETTLMKLGGEKWMTRRLLLSTLAPGDIVEFQWEESWDGWAWFQFVFCQESLPVRNFVLTMDIDSIRVNLAWYNTPRAQIKKKGESHLSVTMENLPAFETEPDAPPELETRGYVLIAYGEVERIQSLGWLKKAGWLSYFAKQQASPDAKIRALAESLCGKSDSNEAKHRKLYAYCQEKIINVDFDESPQSLKERVKHKEPRTAAQVLKAGRGDSMEVNFLFAALASAVATDARIVCLCPKDLRLNTDIDNGWYFSAPVLVACRQEGEWTFLNPGNPAQAFGELRWQEEGVSAMLSDEDKLLWASIPSTPARKNLTRRAATLQLAADGTLEGEAEMNYTGQAALQWRIQHRKTPPAALEKEVREEIIARIPGAEVEQVRFENAQTPGTPLVLHYHLKIQNYATGAGTRLFMVPNIFEVGTTPRYPAERRQQHFFYPYAYQVLDDIRIIIPAGLVANTGEPPKTVSNDYLSQQQHIFWQFDAATRTVIYKRDFNFGTSGSQLSKPMYIENADGIKADAKKPRQLLHGSLDERMRSRNSEALALEPVEAGPVAAPVPPTREKL